MKKPTPRKEDDQLKEKPVPDAEKKRDRNGGEKGGGLTIDVSYPAPEREPPRKH